MSGPCDHDAAGRHPDPRGSASSSAPEGATYLRRLVGVDVRRTASMTRYGTTSGSALSPFWAHVAGPQPSGSPKNVESKEAKVSNAQSLVAGALAGALAKTAAAPLDRVKILYQVNSARSFTLRKALKTIYYICINTGVRGLWRGNLGAMLRVVPYSSVVYFTYSKYSHALTFVFTGKDVPENSNVFIRFFAGAAAGATGTYLTYPLDLLRARMAAHWDLSPRYASYREAIAEISRTEGPRALFAGIKPTLVGIIPYAGISFATFETMKAWKRASNPDGDVSVSYKLFSGGMAGLVAQTATYPLHVLRRRLQVHDNHTSVKHGYHESIWKALRNIYLKEGLANGLFKGLPLTWIKGPFTVAISFTLNDLFKKPVFNPMQKRFKDFREVPHADAESDDLGHVVNAPKPEPLSTVQSLVAGGFAGGVAKTIIAPGDRVKILYQVNHERKFSLFHAVKTGRHIVRHSGYRGLWRGNLATLIRVVPYSSITYATYDVYDTFFESILNDEYVFHSLTLSQFLAGSAAGATATTLTYPLDLLRARMAAHWGTKPKYSGYASAIAEITKKEGPLVLFSGIKPTLLGSIPYSGLSFGLFGTFKKQIMGYYGIEQERDIPVMSRLMAGGLAGLLAQSMTYPLDILRRRMQVDHGKYRSMWHAFVTIYRQEGLIGGLYKGLSMNWIKGPIAVGVSFVVNDIIKNRFREYNKRSLVSLKENKV